MQKFSDIDIVCENEIGKIETPLLDMKGYLVVCKNTNGCVTEKSNLCKRNIFYESWLCSHTTLLANKLVILNSKRSTINKIYIYQTEKYTICLFYYINLMVLQIKLPSNETYEYTFDYVKGYKFSTVNNINKYKYKTWTKNKTKSYPPIVTCKNKLICWVENQTFITQQY